MWTDVEKNYMVPHNSYHLCFGLSGLKSILPTRLKKVVTESWGKGCSYALRFSRFSFSVTLNSNLVNKGKFCTSMFYNICIESWKTKQNEESYSSHCDRVGFHLLVASSRLPSQSSSVLFPSAISMPATAVF
jgi:hypothetical protein